MIVRCWLLILLFLTANSFSQGNDSSINILSENTQEYIITKQYVYSATTKNKGIEEIIANPSILKFTANKLVNTGAFNHYNWIKIDLKNNSNQTEFIFEFNQTYVDSLSFFLVKDNQVIKSYPKKGLYFKENNTPSFLTNKYAYIYPFSISLNDSVSIYVNGVVNDGAFRVMNKIWSLSEYETRKKDITVRSTYLIFFAGFTTLVILLSLTMFFFSKQSLYLYYAGFVTVVFLNLMAVRHFYSPVYLENYFLFGNNFNEMLGYLQLVLVVMYANHLFALKTSHPSLYRILKIIAIAIFVSFILLLFLRNFQWFYAFSYYLSKIELVAITLFVYGIAIYLIKERNVMAYYFIVAYSPLVFFIIHFILTAMKLTTSYNPLQWEFVIFFEIAVLSIAMAHKYYHLIKENRIYHKRIYTQKLRISRDLHDNIGSHLTFIISSIDNLKYLMSTSDKKVEKRLSEISSFASNTISQLRDTIWAMNKNTINYEDFQSRVLTFIEKAKLAKKHININFSSKVNSNIEFSSIIGITIFRVLQESINNTLKYADAAQIDITIIEHFNYIEISVKDDGIGFDLKTVVYGNGLENIQSRIEEIGGITEIKSEVGKGTLIYVKLQKNTINNV